MRRVRWLSAKWPVSLRTLGGRMKTQVFTSDSFDGFVIERIRDTTIEGHFIEKLAYQETTTDPFGNEHVFDRIAYRKADFTLFSEFPNIELHDPQRSSKELVNRLLELCNFSLTVTPLSINVLDWVTAFRRQVDRNIVVDSLQLSGLELEEGISAKILLRGEKDVRAALEHLAAKRKFVLEKVQLKVEIGTVIVPIHLTNSGATKVPEDYLNELLPILRSSLPAQD